MIGLEKVIHEYKPDYLIVVGDVNSTLAAALTANKMNIKLIHVESGLRSFDRSMPEEHNRVLTDQLTDIFFVTEESGKQNLLKEGKPEEKIFFVGNTMIDTLVAYEEMIRKSNILESLNLQPGKYILMTMHRPANVDSKEGLLKMIDIIEEICKEFKLVFPIHPRTVNRLMEFDLFAQLKRNKNLCLTEPAGYLNFQKLILESFLVITDSGGIQEETTFRKIPCLTLRANTERPSTIEIGSNKLLPYEKKDIMLELDKVRKGTFKKGNIPPLWDGKATERIFQILDIGF
jgi:UDP-N-acetylglucosamine 2-epimerase (non-hydrolysing)